MNKLLSEILRGNWMLSADAADKAMEIAYQILSGKNFVEKEKKFNLQFFDFNQSAIKLSTSTDEPTNLSALPPNTTAVVPINGVLTKYDNCSDYGTQSLASMINQLADNSNVSAIVLHIDSPGGTADGSYDLAQSVIYAKSKKPVVAYADGLMASAAFRTGMNANMIVAKPGTIIGSIGTMFSIRINRDTKFEDVSVYADTSSEKNLPFEELVKNGNSTLIKETLLNPMNEIFLNEVRQARPNIPEAALKGATYIGKEAKKMGMFDKEGNLNTAIQEAQKLSKQRIKQSSNPLNNSQMSFTTKFPKISAFFGLTDEATAEKETLSQTEILALESVAGDNLQLKAEVATLKENVAAKDTAISTLTTERDEWKEKAESYGKQPGSTPLVPIEQKEKKYDFSHIKDDNIREHYEKTWNQK